MRVGELEDLLARLPHDMHVFVSGGGPGAFHIGVVRKTPRRTLRAIGQEPIACEPAVHLEAGYWHDGRRRLWYDPDPDPLILGRWPKPKEGPRG